MSDLQVQDICIVESNPFDMYAHISERIQNEAAKQVEVQAIYTNSGMFATHSNGAEAANRRAAEGALTVVRHDVVGT